MQPQLEQPEYDDPKTSKTTAALEPTSDSKLVPTAQAFQKGQWIVTQIFGFLVHLSNYPGRFFNTYKQVIINIALALGAIIALRIILAVIDALNDIPLVAPTFELVGFGYSLWFFYRYLLKPSNRQELAQEIQGFLNEGSGQLYKPGEIVPTSGQYELINSDGGSEGREITSIQGEPFPPTPESGMHYKLVNATKHKKT